MIDLGKDDHGFHIALRCEHQAAFEARFIEILICGNNEEDAFEVCEHRLRAMVVSTPTALQYVLAFQQLYGFVSCLVT